MKKILSAAILTGFLFMAGCGDQNPIGPDIKILPEYTLPQEGGSAWTNDWIQNMYDKYGSYFIYTPGQLDFQWTMNYPLTSGDPDSIVLGDPVYADDLLKFLDKIWLSHLPETFKKELGIPYRVFLVDKIKQKAGYYGYLPVPNAKSVGKSITFSGLYEEFAGMLPAQKTTMKTIFDEAIWTDYYAGQGIIPFPEEFYALTDYTTPLGLPGNGYDTYSPAAKDIMRGRGVLPGYAVNITYYGGVVGTMVAENEWCFPSVFATILGQSMDTDRKSYIYHLFEKTDAQIAPYLEYPLVKKKFDFLIDYYKSFGIDPRSIANMSFE